MDGSKNIVSSALAALIVAHIPLDANSKMQLGLLLSYLFDKILNMDMGSKIYEYINWFLGKLFFGYLFSSQSHVTIWKWKSKIDCYFRDENNSTIVYMAVQDYMLEKFWKKIQYSNVDVVSNGSAKEIRMNVSERMNKPILFQYEGHNLKLYFIKNDKEFGEGIQISINSPNCQLIRQFLKEITEKYQMKASRFKNLIHLFIVKSESDVAKPSNSDEIVDNKTVQKVSWKKLIINTFRTIENTVLGDKQNQEIYGDIETFISSKKAYQKRGQPYQRGYLLHGAPGTGKTSIVRAIANAYNMDVFHLNLNTLIPKSIYDLGCTIQETCNNTRGHILCIDEIDRVNLEDYSSILLQVLDGIMEFDCRIIFMMTNNYEKISNFPELIRPGRIDKIVYLGNCDVRQTLKFYNIFYPEYKLDEKKLIASRFDIVPCNLLSLFTTYIDKPESMRNYLYGKIDKHQLENESIKNTKNKKKKC